MTDRKLAARKKLLGVLSRGALEELSQMDRPWNADRATLTSRALEKWDADDVRSELEALIKKAS